ncbi:phosphotransferase family protein [Halorubellus salinus]|uniref:phosphotransferase family protein n=1 Tax=Halorubellus salinus TaxID=755309 RepID=UPI001D05D75D|nr:phosphotransferase family protein [Halorubellus salinus]
MDGNDDAQAYFERLVDVDSLRSFLEAEIGPAEQFDVTRHKAGHSNETLFVTWGDDEYVIRRPPPGEIADTAHDVLREHHVVESLQDTDVPLPETVIATDDHDVIGCDFYMVERLDGHVLRDEEPSVFAAPEHRKRIGEELVDTLAAIHGIDYEAVGLGDFGRPKGFTERQVDRWQKQLDWAFEVTAAERTVPPLETVGEWLEANVPDSYPHTLVHGDYKLDNVMYGPTPPPELVGVFDWELSTLGDPLTDLGWMLAYWREADDDPPAIPELTPTLTEAEGYPSRQALVDRYEAQTGISFDNPRFYLALAVYKLCGLGEMFFRRYLEGNSDDDLYPIMEDRVPALAARAQRIIDGDETL